MIFLLRFIEYLFIFNSKYIPPGSFLFFGSNLEYGSLVHPNTKYNYHGFIMDHHKTNSKLLSPLTSSISLGKYILAQYNAYNSAI